MTTKIGERSPAQKKTAQQTTAKAPLTGPPPPTTNGADDADAEAIDQLASMAPKTADAFGGPRLARADFAAPTPRAGSDGPDLRIDDDDLSGGAASGANDVAGHMGALPAPRAPSSTFATVDDAIAALEHTYGVTVQRGTFSLEELSRVHESLALVPAKDRAALRGVTLERESAAPSTLQAQRGDGGTLAGYTFNGSEPESSDKRYPHITFYDAAFPSTSQPAEDRRLSQSVVLHEVAHVINGGAAGKTKLAFQTAQDARHAADAAAAAAEPAFSRTLAAFRAVRATEPKSRDFDASTAAWNQAVTALRAADTPQKLKQATSQLAKATQARDAALARLPAGPVKESAQNLVDAQNTLSAPELRAAQARVDEETAVQQRRALVADAPGADAQAVMNADSNTAAAFAHAVKDPVTAYGAEGADENFAEAYALYRRDPALLRQLSPAAHAYMKKHHP